MPAIPGAPCTAANCARCFGEGPRSFCGFACTVDADPRASTNCAAGFACIDLIGNYPGDYDARVCRPSCVTDADCPAPDWSCHELFFEGTGAPLHFCYDDGE